MFITDYMPQVLNDVYLWRVSRRWRTTTNLEEADVVLLLSFPLLSLYAGKCKKTTHKSRHEDVYDWASVNLPSTTPAAVVCPSFTGCDGNEINDKFGTNVKILLKERNPKWLLSKSDRVKRVTPPALFTELVYDQNRTIIMPYTAHHNLQRWHTHYLNIKDDNPYEVPHRCNSSDTDAPWCDASGRTKPKWKKKSGVLFIGDTRGDKVREAIGRISEHNDVTVSYTSLNPKVAERERSTVKSYASQMMHTRFCLCPRGDSPTSRRLFDAIVAGCLPIVISDDIDRSLPFPDVIPYDSFWFRIKEAEWISDPKSVVDRIVAVPEQEIGSRLRIMGNYASLLDWTDASEDSGLRTIIDEIMKADRT